ncbi:MAG: hypothetical protein ACD_40C00086G0003 [uncultured bacterium]|nr:MAG: hypothetical protein ACD_40C00086G0003 [uncultured bacterium]
MYMKYIKPKIINLATNGRLSIPRKMLRERKVKIPGKMRVGLTKTGWLIEPIVNI